MIAIIINLLFLVALVLIICMWIAAEKRIIDYIKRKDEQ